MTTLDLNNESLDHQLQGDMELLMHSQDIPVDIPKLVMDKPPGHSPAGLQGDPVSVSPVTLNGTQVSHRHMQDPLMATLDLNKETQDPQLKGDREILLHSHEKPVDMAS